MLSLRILLLGRENETQASYTSLTYQIIGSGIIKIHECPSLNMWIPRMALPSPSKQCWDEETLSRQAKCTGLPQTTHCLGEGVGGGGGTGENCLNCLKTLVPHYRHHQLCKSSKWQLGNKLQLTVGTGFTTYVQ